MLESVESAIIWNMASIELTRLYLEIIPRESIN